MNNLTVNDVKLKQYMLITKAGLIASQSNEKSKTCMEKKIMSIFAEAVNNYTLPASFAGFDRNALLRTKNFLVTSEKLDADDLHTGGSLWRKYREIRLILLNDFGAILAKNLIDGLPPPGKSFSDILLEVRNQLHEANEDIAEKKSKSVKGYKRHNFSERWYPAEWEAFITYGAGSSRPVESLISKKNSGLVATGSPASREVRKRNRHKEEPQSGVEGNLAERSVFVPKRTSQEMIQRKERIISKKRDATTAFGLMVVARKERVNELHMLLDLESDPTLKESRRKTLMEFLDTTPPSCPAADTSDEEDHLDSEDNAESSAYLNVESDSFDRWNRVRENDGATKGNEDDDSDDSGDTEDIHEAAQMAATRSCEPLLYPSASAAIPCAASASARTPSNSSSSSSSMAHSVQEAAALPATSPPSPPIPSMATSSCLITEQSGESKINSNAADESKKITKSSSSKSALQTAQDVNNDLDNAIDFLGKKSNRSKK